MQRHECNKLIYYINYLISEVLLLYGKIVCYMEPHQFQRGPIGCLGMN
jgi:hypothetical protein